MISGLVLKYLNGECFVICGCYKYSLLASTKFNLTVPSSVLLVASLVAIGVLASKIIVTLQYPYV